MIKPLLNHERPDGELPELIAGLLGLHINFCSCVFLEQNPSLDLNDVVMIISARCYLYLLPAILLLPKHESMRISSDPSLPNLYIEFQILLMLVLNDQGQNKSSITQFKAKRTKFRRTGLNENHQTRMLSFTFTTLAQLVIKVSLYNHKYQLLSCQKPTKFAKTRLGFGLSHDHRIM